MEERFQKPSIDFAIVLEVNWNPDLFFWNGENEVYQSQILV